MTHPNITFAGRSQQGWRFPDSYEAIIAQRLAVRYPRHQLEIYDQASTGSIYALFIREDGAVLPLRIADHPVRDRLSTLSRKISDPTRWVKRNACLAKPSKFRGRGMRGVVTHPGFHTTDKFGVACTYAQAKVEDLLPGLNQTGGILSKTKPWSYPIHDYPVIVSLVMNGLTRLPDYDAFEYWAGPVADFLHEFEQYGKGRTFENFWTYVDRLESPSQDAPNDLLTALLSLLDGYPAERAPYQIRDFLEAQPDPDRALDTILRNPANPVFLMHICQQYRYLEDVPEWRICAVDYMRPLFDYMLPHYDNPEWEEERWDEKTEALERAGYTHFGHGNLEDEQDPITTSRVYEIPPESITPDRGQALMPWGERSPRVEFHGTNYVNLRWAAPGLTRKLPAPPEPYRRDA